MITAYNPINSIIEVFDETSIDNKDYEGDLKEGIPHGYGKRLRNREFSYYNIKILHCSYYEGEWKNGYFHGYGILIIYNKDDVNKIQISHEGNFINGKKHGYGVQFNADEGLLEGNYINGDIIGFAKMTYLNGDIYEGGWDCECRHGWGKMTFINGSFLECEWNNDEPLN